MAKQHDSHREVWEKWDWIWHISALTFFVLHIALGLGNHPPKSPLFFLGLSALLALWYIPFIAMPITHGWNTPRRVLLYFFLGWGLWAGLLALEVGSLVIVGMFYPLIFTRLPVRWAMAVATSQTLGLYLLFILFNPTENWFLTLMVALGLLIGGTVIGVFIAALIKQSAERKRLLDEFTQTRASLLKVERKAGMLAERQRLARDIHDTLAQNLTSIIMHLSAARLGDPTTIQTHVQQAEQTAREGLDEARRIIWDMRPESLENASLVENIEGVAARWSVENTVKVAVNVTGTPDPLNASIDLALLRICQEALHNIKKHARARHVNITLSYMPDMLALDVADDGRGFDPARNGRGFGLKSMRERVEELGGELTVESESGKGTKIAVQIPITEET